MENMHLSHLHEFFFFKMLSSLSTEGNFQKLARVCLLPAKCGEEQLLAGPQPQFAQQKAEHSRHLGDPGSPALTVTALTNCSLQLLLPTTRARFVFLISLSTVLCGRGNTTQKEFNEARAQANKQRKRSCCEGGNVAQVRASTSSVTCENCDEDLLK